MIALLFPHKPAASKLIRLLVTGCFLVLALAFPGSLRAQKEDKADGQEPKPSQESKSPQPADDGGKEPDPLKADAPNVAEAQAPERVDFSENENPDPRGIPFEGKPHPEMGKPLIDYSPDPPSVSEAGSFFSDEELAELGIQPRETEGMPPFAEDMPGSIPDTSPRDLFITPGEGRSFVFETLLGETKLPRQNAQSLISRFAGDPSGLLEENQARIVVPTGNITGSTETKQFRVDGGLTLFYSDVSMSGDYADIDEKNEVAVIYGNVSIVDPKYTMKTDELRIYFEDKQFQAKGFVQFKKDASQDSEDSTMELGKKDRLREDFAGKEFELFCKDLYYDWGTKEMTALGSVRLIHPSFNGTMERIDYNDETKEYEMSGSVVLDITDYDWVFDNDLVAADDIDKVNALTDSNTKITCDRLVYSEASGIARFYSQAGSQVVFDQGARKIEAQYIEVNDQTKDFHAEGTGEKPVFYQQEDGEWLFLGGLVNRDEVSEDLVETLEKQLTIQAGSFTYNFDRKRLELVGGVNIEGSGKSLQAGIMIQDETAKFLLLKENVRIKPDASSEIVAAQVYIDTENDVFTFVGLVEGQIESDDLVPAEDAASSSRGEIEIQQGIFQQTELPGATNPPQDNNVARR